MVLTLIMQQKWFNSAWRFDLIWSSYKYNFYQNFKHHVKNSHKTGGKFWFGLCNICPRSSKNHTDSPCRPWAANILNVDILHLWSCSNVRQLVGNFAWKKLGNLSFWCIFSNFAWNLLNLNSNGHNNLSDLRNLHE